MATEGPETIDAASVRTAAQRRMRGGQLSCLARNGRAAARGRKLNAGIAASRARRSRFPARSGHCRDPNGRVSDRNSARRNGRTSPSRDYARADVEILLLKRTSRIPRRKKRRRTCCDRNRVGMAKRVAATSDPRPHTYYEVRPETSNFGLHRQERMTNATAACSRIRLRRRPTTVPVFRPRPVRRTEMTQATPKPSPRSRLPNHCRDMAPKIWLYGEIGKPESV